MRVSYITMLFPAGTETFATNDVRTLTAKGVAIEVHSLRPARADTEALAVARGVEGVPRTTNGVGASLRGLLVGLLHPALSWKLLVWLGRMVGSEPRHAAKGLALAPRALDVWWRLRAAPPDVLHLFWGHYPTIVGFLLRQTHPQIPITMSLGAYDLSEAFPGTAWAVERAAFVRTHGDTNVPILVETYDIDPGRIMPVINGLDLSLVRSDVDRVPLSIVTVARLIESKGIDDVLEAFAEVHRADARARLSIVGEGPDRPRLEAIAEALGISKVVAFLGHRPHREVFEILARSDALLFLSRKPSERLPNVVKEAMASGCLCVASDTIGIEELIPDRAYGRVVPMSAPAVAAAALLDLLGGDDAEETRERGRRRAFEHFDVRATTEAYIVAWSELIDRPD